MVLVVAVASITSCGSNTYETSEIPNEALITPSGEAMLSPQDFVVPDWFTDYPSILEEYRRFAECEITSDSDKGWLFDRTIFSGPDYNQAGNWGNALHEAKLVSYRDYNDPRDAFGYAIEDLNGDENPELILLLQDYTVLAVISTFDGKPKVLGAYYSRHDCGIDNTGTLYTCSSGGAFYFSISSYKISPDGSELILIEEFGADGYLKGENATFYYKLVNGDKTRISDADFNELSNKFPKRAGMNTYAYRITQDSGMDFVPLFE